MPKHIEFLANFRFRKRLLAVVDALIVVIAGLLVNLPLPIFAERIDRMDLFAFLMLCAFCCFTCQLLFGAYNKLWRYFNAKDYWSCVQGVMSGFAAAFILNYVVAEKCYVLFTLVTAVVATSGVCLFRYIFKGTFVALIRTGEEHGRKTRTMIIGAGEACRVLLDEIDRLKSQKNDAVGAAETLRILPVCLMDDDREKIGKMFHGVLVAGGTADIEKIAKLERIEQIIFAIPSCPPEDRAAILDLCSKTRLPIKVLPFVGSLQEVSDTRKSNYITQIRDIKVEDLLGRDPIKFDNKDIRKFIENKVCMVTGGGGSIGSELVRQIAKYHPTQVIIVDIYENNAYEIQQELVMEYGKSLNLVTIIASVRDYFRMNQIFKKYRPEVVFHAAAHKHVPLMENNPMEAIKNNVVGTFYMATLSLLYDVKKFVMISTDKAVNPTNVMGASKRCCEMIVQFYAQKGECHTEFVTTRFGNVLGSNGSVIPLFKKQIEQGKPVTVTHPDIIRYFMTIPEAVNLVLEAASLAHGGEIFVLDMGQPVKIVTLAENLIRMYGKVPYKDVEIKFTGLRPGEKLLEELLMREEGLQKTKNKLIYIGKQIPIEDSFIKDLWKLKSAALENNDAVAIEALHRIVPTFTTPEEFNKTIRMQKV